MADPKLRPLDVRDALLEVLPTKTSGFGTEVEPRFVHVPNSHAKALHPDTQLVVGMRGAGKSFWWRALQNPKIRGLIEQRGPRIGLTEETEIFAGFGETPNPDLYPSSKVLKKLLAENYDPRLIWWTVIAHALTRELPSEAQISGSWQEKVDRVEEDPEHVDRALFELDQKYQAEDRYGIVLFDALDRSATNWNDMYRLIRGLLGASLDLRPYRRLRVKCFLRVDQLDEQRVGTFADASKILSGMVELSWPPLELYSLLFQYLGNTEEGSFRKALNERLRLDWEQRGKVFVPPSDLRHDETQKEIFHSITGPWMGRDRRRGFPYTWVPNHLADAEGRVSPRTFLAALRKAAEDTAERYLDHPWSLHYESLKRGVSAASVIRVRELQEDYPWVQTCMKPLDGSVVPCLFEDVTNAWEKHKVLTTLKQRVADVEEKLPPAHLEEGHRGLRLDLEDLGIFLRLKDGRVNIPDVYRLGYGLGRRGGVKPLRATKG